MRKLRFLPRKGTLVSITCRTVQGRFLLRPGPQLNDLLLGALGRAQRNHQMTLNAVSVLSNHVHLLATPDDAKQLSSFMRDFASKLAREVNRATGWRGPVFERRYEMTAVTDEEAAQVERLGYVLAQGVKEGLVERARDWPGVHSVGALLDGAPLQGHWFDRSREHAARNQGEDFERLRYATLETVTLAPIPCWAHLSPERYRERIAALVDAIETGAARARLQTETTVEGVESILAKDPHHRPSKLARSPAPRVHAATKAARRAFYDLYREFVAAFRQASERLRMGDRWAAFPVGSFPPGLPFVVDG